MRRLRYNLFISNFLLTTSYLHPGGKAKPLKAPKKEKKELDEEDLAYREKLKAGKLISKMPVGYRNYECLYFFQMQRQIRKWQRRLKAKDLSMLDNRELRNLGRNEAHASS